MGFRPARRSCLLAVGLASLVVVVACSSGMDVPREAGVVAVSLAEPPPAERWTPTADPATGISFLLPGRAEVDTRSANAAGTTPNRTEYTVEVRGGLTVSAGVMAAPGADYSTEGLDDGATQIVTGLRAAGSSDAILTDRRYLTVGVHPALDFRVSFTATNGTRSIWLTRSIGDGTRVVQLQTIAFADPKDEPSLTSVAERYHRILVDSVSLP
jgi:hypothetical protein